MPGAVEAQESLPGRNLESASLEADPSPPEERKLGPRTWTLTTQQLGLVAEVLVYV